MAVSDPGYFEFEIPAGEDFKWTFTFTLGGAPQNISTYTNFRCDLKLTPDGATIASLSWGFDSDGTDGKFFVELDKVATRALQTDGHKGGSSDIFYDDGAGDTKHLGQGTWSTLSTSTAT